MPCRLFADHPSSNNSDLEKYRQINAVFIASRTFEMLTQRTPDLSVLWRDVESPLVIVDGFGKFLFASGDPGHLGQSANTHRIVTEGVLVGNEGSSRVRQLLRNRTCRQ